MSETRVFEVIDALVAKIPTAPGMPAGVDVFDGFPLAAVTGSFVAVGVEDPADEGRAESGESTQEFAHAAGRSRDEVGSIRCAISTISGDADPKVARDDAHTILAAVAALCRSGVDPFNLPNMRKVGVTGIRLYQDQTEHGAVALLMFTVAYIARI